MARNCCFSSFFRIIVESKTTNSDLSRDNLDDPSEEPLPQAPLEGNDLLIDVWIDAVGHLTVRPEFPESTKRGWLM